MRTFFAFFSLLLSLAFMVNAETRRVEKLQIYEKEGRTELAFTLNKPFSLDLQEDPKNNRITIYAPDGVEWGLDPNDEIQGLVEEYEMSKDLKDRSFLSVYVLPGTDIEDYGRRKNDLGEAEFFVVLEREMEEKKAPVKHEFKRKKLPELRQVSPLLVHENKAEEKDLKEKQVKDSEPELAPKVMAVEKKEPLQAVRISEEAGETVITLETLEKIAFEPDLEQKKKKIYIELPKVDWVKVDTGVKQGGVIQGYYVDDSHENFSRLVMSLSAHADMVVKSPVQESGGLWRYRIALTPGDMVVPTPTAVPEKAEEVSPPPKKRRKVITLKGMHQDVTQADLYEDLKALNASLMVPSGVAYAPKEDLKKDPATRKPTVLKNFRIAPSGGMPSPAGEKPKPKHLDLPSAGTMFSKLQGAKEAQISNEGTAPAWVVEAKMKEKR